MRVALIIALAGGLGSVSRYYAGMLAYRILGDRLPYGTLAVNVAGSFAIGLAMMFFRSRGLLGSDMRIAVTVGFLGGFTTYSAFALETVDLMHADRIGLAGVYVIATLVLAGLACAAGMLAARWLLA